MAQTTLRDYLQETEDALSAGRVDDALRRCQEILNQYPESLEAQRLLGEVYLSLGQLDEARQACDWVLTNDPENVLAYCNRALISERQSDIDTALDCYQQAYELSRDSKIRQIFNRLGAPVGQQGFMFSRAGLARLYLRGDLLTQAILEWEAVLSTNPDRLDARTGLLETYWREGMYDRVEQLATQILQDVPGCEKALLLLSFVLARKDVKRAQELFQRVEALDPDLVMAHDLFGDALASNAGEPFFQWLKKAPALLQAAGAVSAQPAQAGVSISSSPSISSNGLTSWSGFEQWSAEGAAGLLQETPTKENSLSLPVWTSDSIPGFDTWQDIEQKQPVEPVVEQHDEEPVVSGDTPTLHQWEQFSWQRRDLPQNDEQREPWELLQEALSGTNGKSQPEPQDRNPVLPDESVKQEDSANRRRSNDIFEPGNGLDTSSSTWSSPPKEDAAPKEDATSAPPAWLSMLTQSERRQMSGPLSQPAPIEQPPAEAVQKKADALPPVEKKPASPVWEPEPQEPEPALDDDEESFFGPAWLRSLGATMMDDEHENEPVVVEPPATPETRLPVMEQKEPVALQPPVQQMPPVEQKEEETRAPAQLSSADFPWMDAFSHVPAEEWAKAISQVHGDNWQEQLAQMQASNRQEQPDEPTRNEPAAPETETNWNEQFSHIPDPVQAQQDLSLPANSPWYSMPPSSSDETWVPQVAHESDAEAVEQNLLTTLEELEQGLRAKGFVPLEPNSLSSIARAQGESQDVGSLQPDTEIVPEVLTQPEVSTEDFFQASQPSLSSALAALGNFGAVPEAPASPVSEPMATEDVVQEEASPEQVFTQAWGQSLPTLPPSMERPAAYEPLPQPVQEEPRPIQGLPVWQETFTPPPPPAHGPSQPAVAPLREQPLPVEPVLPKVEYTPVPPLTKPPVPAVSRTETTRVTPVEPVPAARFDAWVDSELETTMRRPAIRLQPMQKPIMETREQVIAPANYTVERPVANKAAGENLSYQQRLIRGYQHQLVGDYDEAMQEYRVIIRNSPELIAEVISNVRALLKLAPKYSAGYRVLGDAYMRQGEYLQAMEAYNKALTMAKKTRS